VAHGSNELVTLDSSGVVRQRLRGGLAGRPALWRRLSPDGTLFVTEFNGDRVSRIAADGSAKAFGQKGGASTRSPSVPNTPAVDEEAIFMSSISATHVWSSSTTKAYSSSLRAQVVVQAIPGFLSPTGICVLEG